VTAQTPPGFDPGKWAAIQARTQALAARARIGDPAELRRLAATLAQRATDATLKQTDPDLFAIVLEAREPLDLNDNEPPVQRVEGPAVLTAASLAAALAEADDHAAATRRRRKRRARPVAERWTSSDDVAVERMLAPRRIVGRGFRGNAQSRKVLTAAGAVVPGGHALVERWLRDRAQEQLTAAKAQVAVRLTRVASAAPEADGDRGLVAAAVTALGEAVSAMREFVARPQPAPIINVAVQPAEPSKPRAVRVDVAADGTRRYVIETNDEGGAT
jgi:hypothetical protein